MRTRPMPYPTLSLSGTAKSSCLGVCRSNGPPIVGVVSNARLAPGFVNSI